MIATTWLAAEVLPGASVAVRGWSSTLVVAALNIAMLWRSGEQNVSLAATDPPQT